MQAFSNGKYINETCIILLDCVYVEVMQLKQMARPPITVQIMTIDRDCCLFCDFMIILQAHLIKQIIHDCEVH